MFFKLLMCKLVSCYVNSYEMKNNRSLYFIRKSFFGLFFVQNARPIIISVDLNKECFYWFDMLKQSPMFEWAG